MSKQAFIALSTEMSSVDLAGDRGGEGEERERERDGDQGVKGKVCSIKRMQQVQRPSGLGSVRCERRKHDEFRNSI